jgi:hypothetical protein
VNGHDASAHAARIVAYRRIARKAMSGRKNVWLEK